jgi:hypothetical protein
MKYCTTKLAKITSLGGDMLIKIRKIQQSLEASANSPIQEELRWNHQGKLLITWQGLCLVKGILAQRGIGKWAENREDNNTLSKETCENLLQNNTTKEHTWKGALPQYIGLESEAFHIARMWKNYKKKYPTKMNSKNFP